MRGEGGRDGVEGRRNDLMAITCCTVLWAFFNNCVREETSVSRIGCS